MLRSPASETQVTHLGRLWLYLFAVLVLAFLVAPVLVVVPMSFSDSRYLRFPPEGFSLRWYETYFASLEWVGATLTSFKVAALVTLLATPVGVAAAYGLNQSGLRGARLVSLMLISPLIVPVIILAIGVFYLYARVDLVNTVTGLVLAHAALALPFVVVTTTSGLQQFDPAQERAARSLGASRWVAFRTVTLPQLRGPVISGALFAFITSLDEVVISVFIAGGENMTLPRRMFSGLRDQVDPTIAAISSMLILLSVLLLVVSVMLGGRKGGRG
ncbi:ABC transporter permease [Paroceanicella profunda]|uniref:ABC transporter permease n=1 Tax=Paroceanicella profunda TaxID=2579971 RepID=A0A5B8FVM8_9RHOB|nr:ABC transporter permease [Paroceanicella profunda]QDL90539.1 ABC transporter permease [Paroceanicella profunda]